MTEQELKKLSREEIALLIRHLETYLEKVKKVSREKAYNLIIWEKKKT